MLTPEQINQFSTVAKSIFELVPDSLEDIRELVNEAGPARDDVAMVLEAGGFDEVRLAHIAAQEEVLDVASRIGALKREPTTETSADTSISQTVDSRVALAEARAARDLALPTLWFLTASACIAARSLLDAYVEVSTAFLRRPPGSKQVGRRILTVLGTGFKELAVPPGVETALEGVRQIVTSPLDADIARMRAAAAENARVDILREAHEHLHDQTEVMGESVRISVEGANEARAWIDHATAQMPPPESE